MTTAPVDRIPQIDAMRLGVDYRFTVQVREFKLHLRPLAISEVVKVAHEVASDLSQMPKVAQTSLTENMTLAKRTLVMASTPDVGVNQPTITELIFDKMTPDELQFIYKQYLSGCDRANPALEILSYDEVVALVEDVKKKASPAEQVSALTELSFLQLVSMVHLLLIKGE